MICPGCGNSNPDGARFCGECGQRLTAAVVCSACGASNRGGQKFCNACGQHLRATGDGSWESGGLRPSPVARLPTPDPRSYTPRHLAERILTGRSALEGERKQVTVLFADVKGSMDLAEQVDPEEWHRIMDRFFAILTEGIHRFEGSVNQYTGDGIMALFGAPLAHEDHARRACYAALHLSEELRGYAEEIKRTQGLNFSVRMGLNSGEVIVGKIGDDLRMDYTAQGHTVGLAARMESLADPGKAYLTEDTAKLVEGFFALRDLGSFHVKGVREPARVYELQGVGPLRTRLDVSRARGLSRFVGRDTEIAILEGALARAIRGEGQIIGIVAEPGLGKSRLCFEFAERCRARAIEITSTNAVPHGKWIPFLLVLELLRNLCGVTEHDSGEAARRKIAGTLLLRDDSLKKDLPLLFEFLGVPDAKHPLPRMDPEARQRQLFGVVKRLIHSRSQGWPAVLIFEDLHWIDGASEAALESLVEVVPSTRTLLIVNFRPEYRAPWMQTAAYQQFALAPLGAEAISELLADLLGTDPSCVELGNLIRHRTGGNPFFIEEVVQSLFDHGALVRTAGPGGRGRAAVELRRPVTEIEIPPTVQAVLAARVDRLTERDKAVLQTAAVIGKEFSGPVLQRVVEEIGEPILSAPEVTAALSGLIRAEFIFEGALYPEVLYKFKHPLTQEVAYHSQLSERRAQVHGAVARAVAQLYPGKLDERAALLAHHWEGAGDVIEAARWSRRAAEWVGSSDPAEAYRRWHKLHELLQSAAPSAEVAAMDIAACTQLLTLGLRVGMSQEEAADTFAHGQALAEQSGDLRSLARLLSTYGMVRGTAGDTDEAVAYIARAVRLAEDSADTGLRLALWITMMLSQLFSGLLHEALRSTDEAIAFSGEDPKLGADVAGFSPYIFLILYRGTILIALGRLPEARRDLDRALELAREHGELELLGMAHGFQTLLAYYVGAVDVTLDHARQAIEIAEKIGSALSRGQAYGMLGVAHLAREEWDDAVAAFQQDLAISRERHTGLVAEAASLAMLAGAYLRRGDVARARATAEEALAVARRRGSRLFECDAQLALARVLLRSDGATAQRAIAAALDAALTLIEATGLKSREPFVHLERAELARVTGDEATRERERRAAHRLLVEMGATLHAERLAKEITI
jgi:class 3 adenylate cyclase/tetratricopeptide (TPR) repeat protein